MRLASALGVVLLAAALQTSLSRFTLGTRWVFDLVLVGVIYSALRWGPSYGVIAGTVGGLIQDALAGGTLGVGGFSKTLVGFAAGVVGAQFVVVQTLPRMVLVAAATVLEQAAVLALQGMIDLQRPAVAWATILIEMVLNALIAFLVFSGVEALPAMLRRRPMRRSGFGARKW